MRILNYIHPETTFDSLDPSSVNSCGVLPVRGDWEGAFRNPQKYMAGDMIKVSCKSGYNFWGQDSWKCNYEGDWEGATWGRDEEWPMCMSKFYLLDNGENDQRVRGGPSSATPEPLETS